MFMSQCVHPKRDLDNVIATFSAPRAHPALCFRNMMLTQLMPYVPTCVCVCVCVCWCECCEFFARLNVLQLLRYTFSNSIVPLSSIPDLSNLSLTNAPHGPMFVRCLNGSLIDI